MIKEKSGCVSAKKETVMIFQTAEILIPQNVDMHKWSVVACDQFTSQPEYWQQLEQLVGDAPSTLELIFPEAWLDCRDADAERARINDAMRRYLDSDVFRALPDSYVYVERTLASGAVRRGLVGVIDLECYDYRKGSTSAVRCTEGTVEERLIPRVAVRREACLELPHILVFIDDAARTVIEPLGARRAQTEQLYDFDLSGGGGHLAGWRITGGDARAVDAALAALADPEALHARYGSDVPAVYAMGDGNHSLATAKLCWEQCKQGLSEAERVNHPARFGLVELVNIHDDAITFEPIHRALFGVDAAAFAETARSHFAAASRPGAAHTVHCVTAAGETDIPVTGLTIGEVIGAAEALCQKLAAQGARIDYIHGDDTAAELGSREGCAAMLLPKMEKDELFPSIIHSGPFPKKSFSIGHAQDKRYYLECRRIR